MEPRVVELRYVLGGFVSITLAPALLHACRGSRERGLKAYEKLILKNSFTGTYINWEEDTLFISHHGSVSPKRLDFTRYVCSALQGGQGFEAMRENCQRLATTEGMMHSLCLVFSWAGSHNRGFELLPKLKEFLQVARCQKGNGDIRFQVKASYDYDGTTGTLLKRGKVFRNYLTPFKWYLPRLAEGSTIQTMKMVVGSRGKSKLLSQKAKDEKQKRLRQALMKSKVCNVTPHKELRADFFYQTPKISSKGKTMSAQVGNGGSLNLDVKTGRGGNRSNKIHNAEADADED